MLRDRILTAVVLLPITVGILIWGSALEAALLMGAVTVIVSYELGRMLSGKLVNEGGDSGVCKWSIVLSIISALSVFSLGVFEVPLSAFSLLWVVLTAVACLSPGEVSQKVGRMLIVSFAGVYCGGCWLAMWQLYMWQSYAAGLIFMMTIVIVADSAAYFAGTRWGRRKLAPTLSPKKSWEGFWCGIVASIVGAIICNVIYGGVFGSVGFVALMGACGAAAGIIGDLIESALKRYAGVKDSGSLLPGHGGFLDRCDAAMFAAPVFIAFLRNFS